MGYFNADEADKYGGNGGTDFFFLKNDKDHAHIRFGYNDMTDVKGLALHEVAVGDKNRYVNCIREAGDPIEACPLCEANYAQKARIFIPVYDVEEDCFKIWERGKNWLTKLSSLIARYNPLVSTVFDIERQGKAGSNKTVYETFVVATDELTLEDLPEIPEVLGGLVLDKTADEMYEYLDTGNFPQDDEDEEAEKPAARNPERDGRKPAGRQTAAPAATRRPAARPGAGVAPRKKF